MVSKTKHPSYPNSTIIEAIIEVFLDRKIESSLFKKIGKLLAADYPELREGKLIRHPSTVDDSEVATKALDIPILQLRNKKVLVQVVEDRLLIHWVAKYEGWEHVEKQFHNVWSLFLDLIPGLSAKRVGLRFINKLDEKKIDQPLTKWLKPSPYYPASILGSKENFFYRGQWSSFEDNQERFTSVSVAEGRLSEKGRPLMLDVDVVAVLKETQKSLKKIDQVLQQLHEEIWKIFSESISENYLNVLNNK